MGNSGWSYAEVLPYFKKSENYELGADEYHGVDGPLHVSVNYKPNPIAKAMVDAAVEAGHPYNPDHNGADIMGVGFNHLNIKDGEHISTAVAFLRPALERPNLSLITNARVHKVNLERTHCTGLIYEQEGQTHTVKSAKEVLLCGGTIESPRVLMMSGIGDKTALEKVGISVAHHLPGVGKNLHDHTLLPVIYESKKPIPDVALNPALTPLHGQLFAKTDPSLPGPDMQPLFFNVPYYTPEQSGPANAFTFCAAGVLPTSRGELSLTGPNIQDPLA